MSKKKVIKRNKFNENVKSDLANEKLFAFLVTFLSIIGFIFFVNFVVTSFSKIKNEKNKIYFQQP